MTAWASETRNFIAVTHEAVESFDAKNRPEEAAIIDAVASGPFKGMWEKIAIEIGWLEQRLHQQRPRTWAAKERASEGDPITTKFTA